jgi:hypothetical protein
MKATALNKTTYVYFQENIGLPSSGPNTDFLKNSLKAADYCLLGCGAI